MEVAAKEYPNKKRKIDKRILYRIIKNCTFECSEIHNDNSIDNLCVQVEIEKENQKEIYYAKDYIPSVVSHQKNAKDVDATIIKLNHLEKKIEYQAIDLKRNLITYGNNNTIRENVMITYSTISHLIEQWNHAHI